MHSLSRDLEERLHKKGKNRALAPEVLQSRTFAVKKKDNKRPIFFHVSHKKGKNRNRYLRDDFTVSLLLW